MSHRRPSASLFVLLFTLAAPFFLSGCTACDCPPAHTTVVNPEPHTTIVNPPSDRDQEDRDRGQD